MLLIAYNQAGQIGDAVRSALAQTYQPLEIIISDDASSDATFAAIEAALAGYNGPHRVITRRNAANQGISAHLSQIAQLAQGELLFVAAGDDMSAPTRCERVVDLWLARERRPDLIATDLADMDEAGHVHERLSPTELDTYRSSTTGWPPPVADRRGAHVVAAAVRTLRADAAGRRRRRSDHGAARDPVGRRGESARAAGALPARRAVAQTPLCARWMN